MSRNSIGIAKGDQGEGGFRSGSIGVSIAHTMARPHSFHEDYLTTDPHRRSQAQTFITLGDGDSIGGYADANHVMGKGR
jgi:hypothetical protein